MCFYVYVESGINEKQIFPSPCMSNEQYILVHFLYVPFWVLDFIHVILMGQALNVINFICNNYEYLYLHNKSSII